MESFRFTTEAIRALPVPAKRQRLADTGQPGLVVALMPGGSRTFYLYVWRRGRQREIRIGDVEVVAVPEARRIAREKLNALELGEDPGAAGGLNAGALGGDRLGGRLDRPAVHEARIAELLDELADQFFRLRQDQPQVLAANAIGGPPGAEPLDRDVEFRHPGQSLEVSVGGRAPRVLDAVEVRSRDLGERRDLVPA